MTGRTAIFPIGNEIEDEAEANDIPRLAMQARGVHEQKILLQNGRMARVQVDRRDVYPGRAVTIVIRPHGAHLQ